MRRATVGAASLLAGAAILAGTSVWWWQHETDQESLRAGAKNSMQAATKAGRAAVPIFGDLAAATVQADLARSTRVLTAEFAAQYEPALAKSAAGLATHRATIAEEVTAAEPVDISTDRDIVHVLVYFTEHATFGDGSPASDRSLQYLLTMKRQGGKWLVDGADAPTQSSP